MSISNTGREVFTTRVMNASPERVFAAWTDPILLAQWWGPNGFSNTFHTFELKTGGTWDFTMHGPDGKDYPNTCVFRRIEAPTLLEFDHVKEMHFYKAVVAFTAVGSGTRIDWTMRFDTARELEPIKKFIERANEENMDRLEAAIR